MRDGNHKNGPSKVHALRLGVTEGRVCPLLTAFSSLVLSFWKCIKLPEMARTLLRKCFKTICRERGPPSAPAEIHHLFYLWLSSKTFECI